MGLFGHMQGDWEHEKSFSNERDSEASLNKGGDFEMSLGDEGHAQKGHEGGELALEGQKPTRTRLSWGQKTTQKGPSSPEYLLATEGHESLGRLFAKDLFSAFMWAAISQFDGRLNTPPEIQRPDGTGWKPGDLVRLESKLCQDWYSRSRIQGSRANTVHF